MNKSWRNFAIIMTIITVGACLSVSILPHQSSVTTSANDGPSNMMANIAEKDAKIATMVLNHEITTDTKWTFVTVSQTGQFFARENLSDRICMEYYAVTKQATQSRNVSECFDPVTNVVLYP